LRGGTVNELKKEWGKNKTRETKNRDIIETSWEGGVNRKTLLEVVGHREKKEVVASWDVQTEITKGGHKRLPLGEDSPKKERVKRFCCKQ